MLLRCVLSSVCVALLAPVVPARARSSDDPTSRVTLDGTSARLPTAVQDLGAEPVPEDQATPQVLGEKLQSEIDKWARVIEEAGVSAN